MEIRYLGTVDEVTQACPVCRKACGRRTCLLSQAKDLECKDFLVEKDKVYRILIFHYLICKLLPVLKQINEEHTAELEIETRMKSSQCADAMCPLTNHIKKLNYVYCRKSDASSRSLPNGKSCNDAGDGHLGLKSVFPMNWSKDLEASAEEIICSYDLPDTSDSSSCCSLCCAPDYKGSGKAAGREDSNDNFLYRPSVEDANSNNLEHFQKHWVKGHPVIIHNVIQCTSSELSWDPVAMFCTYLEKSIAKSENDYPEAKGSSLDWCEVEIGIQNFFSGSLEGLTCGNTQHEMVKLKGWLSCHLFQQHFPAHYDEIIRLLPLQEYLNPKSGLLNLTANFPKDLPWSESGPCIYISYGCCSDEYMQSASVTKLCYDSHDVVNILAPTTDVPLSVSQLSKIKELFKQYKMRGQKKHANERNRNALSQVEIKNATELKDSIGESSLEKKVAMGDDFFDSNFGSGKLSSHLDECDSDFETSIHHCGSSSKDCGAQWDVFRRQDVPKLVEYLKRHSTEFRHSYGFPKHVVHPILDKIFFLDSIDKMRLKEEFKIEPWTFEQHLGEAVIIPAGCPYQIKNLKSCINVVLEFISPENVTDCIQLVDELRSLPDHHKAKKGKLEKQVKKLTVYSINAAIQGIRKLTSSEQVPPT